MKIIPAKASSYTNVTANGIVNCIVDYARENITLIDENNDRLRTCDKSQLKAIAAELETVNKRLEYIINGRH